MDKYDLVVIGSGPAGQRAAIQAAKLKRKVAVIDKRMTVGGVCLHEGTIPSKTLREAVLYLTGFRQRGIYGLSYTLKPDISIQDLMFRCDQCVKSEVDVLVAQFARNGVDLFHGPASFVDEHHVNVAVEGGDRSLEADFVVVACGTSPAHSPRVAVNGRTIIDSDGLYDLTSIPHSMIVVGAGIIGVEYACIFAALGAEVTLVDKRRRVLEFLDEEILEALLFHMREEGIIFRFGEEVTDVGEINGQVVAHTKSNKTIHGDCLLYTVGREGSTRELNLANVGIEADERGRIPVNEHFQTAQPHIYAAGDVIGFPALASSSMEQGRLASAHAFGLHTNGISRHLPYGLFTIPEISMVGRNEEELTNDAIPYEFGIARYREIARGQIIGDRNGMLKLLVHSETRKLLGIHILGEGATELIHIGQAVLALGGTLDYLVENVFNYPTLAECYKVAALDAYNKLGAI
ncbi:MAG: Si-specific NAD(P)(+) transhydrogenase [Chloroflexota bacterium]